MFDVEIISNDDLVLDMLRSLLKRYLIMSTRLAKKQGLKNLTFNNINLFRYGRVAQLDRATAF